MRLKEKGFVVLQCHNGNSLCIEFGAGAHFDAADHFVKPSVIKTQGTFYKQTGLYFQLFHPRQNPPAPRMEGPKNKTLSAEVYLM